MKTEKETENYYTKKLIELSQNEYYDKDVFKEIQELLDNGANIEGSSKSNCTPLLLSSFNMESGIFEYLIKAGANKEHQTNSGETTLFSIANFKDLKDLKLAIDLGLDPYAKSTLNFSLIHSMIFLHSDSSILKKEDTIKYLMSLNIDLKHQTLDGKKRSFEDFLDVYNEEYKDTILKWKDQVDLEKEFKNNPNNKTARLKL